MICNPDKNDIFQMKDIWRLCFFDDRETVDCFYDVCFSFDDCYISKENGTVQAVIQIIPCEIRQNGKEIPSKYLYAVCTHPLFQGRGIMHRLISAAEEIEREKGTKAVLCIPATEKLFGFYSSLGYENAVYCSEKVIELKNIDSTAKECKYNSAVDCSEFNNIRRQFLKDKSFSDFPDKYFALAKEFGYKLLYNESFYAVVSDGDEYIKVSDSAFTENGFNELVFACVNEFGKKEIRIDYSDDGNNCLLKGCIKILDDYADIENNIYLGLKME